MISSLLQLLFPSYCVGCKKSGPMLCSTCTKTLHSHPEICPICHASCSDYHVCTSCKRQGYSYDGICITLTYSGLIKKLLRALKYHHKYSIADFLAQKIAMTLSYNQYTGPWILQHPEEVIVTYVPSHWRRRVMQKGYNQSELLAKHVANQLHMPLLRLFTKTRYTRSQATLDRQQRLQNTHQAYAMDPSIDLSSIKLVIIVDDITTTGSTIRHLADCLKEQWPHLHVRGAVVARSNT